MKILNLITDINKEILKIMKIGFKFSFCFCIFASFILVTYQLNKLPSLFYIGMSLLQSGLFFMVSFIICGFAFNKITNE